MVNIIDYLLYSQIVLAICCLLFILLASKKWAGERTIYQNLPVIGLILIMISGLCDITFD